MNILNILKMSDKSLNCHRRVLKYLILFLLRCVQLGISIRDLDLLSIGMVNDMFVESRNDECKYAALATQEDFDKF